MEVLLQEEGQGGREGVERGEVHELSVLAKSQVQALDIACRHPILRTQKESSNDKSLALKEIPTESLKIRLTRKRRWPLA